MTTASPTQERRIFTRVAIDAYFTMVTESRVLVEWAIWPSFEETGPYEFTLQRGFGLSDEVADWQDIARTVDQPWAYDTRPVFPQKGVTLFYRVVLHTGDNNTYTSQAAGLGTYWDRYDYTLAREIIRKEIMLLRKRTGTAGWLLKRRLFGDPCISCVDPVTKEIIRVDCPVCYGTGIVGGYYPAWEYWLTLNPEKRLVRLTEESGLSTQVISTARALAYPRPATNDIWVHGHTGQRFAFQGDISALARHRGIDLVLDLRLEERARSEPMYLVPTPCLTTYGMSKDETARAQAAYPQGGGD